MKNMMKRTLEVILALCLVVGILPVNANAVIGYGTGDWSNGWSWWSQGQSKYEGMRNWGCLVVAQAKMLALAGAGSGNFNPDIYYEWEVSNGYVNSGMYTLNYAGPQAYASQNGKTLTYEGVTTSNCVTKVWENINAGKYSILRTRDNGDSHYVFVNNDASSQLQRLRVFESWSSSTIPGTRDWNSGTAEVLTYSSNNNVSVTFEPWDSSDTYIRETDASIGQKITVSGGTCTDTGMWLYNSTGSHIASAANGCYSRWVYFKIKEEAGYTLMPGTLYQYKRLYSQSSIDML